MTSFNPLKELQVEIHLNCPSMTKGYTIWHVVGNERKAAISRNADGKDFDWMTDKQMNQFNNGTYKFKMTARMAIDMFQYMY